MTTELDPIDFATPIRGVTSPVVVEFFDGAIGVLDLPEPHTARLVLTGKIDPRTAEFHPDAELGDVVSLLAKQSASRAFRLPQGRVVDDVALGALAARMAVIMAGLVLCIVGGWELLALPHAMLSLIGVIGVLLATFGFMNPRFRGAMQAKAFLPAGGVKQPLARLLATRPQRDRAASIVDRVKAEYGKLVGDVCFRVEFPALFDVAVPETAAFTRAMIAWDSEASRSDAEVSALAMEIRRTFEVARHHAKTVGMTHLGEARTDAETALKALRVATSRTSPGQVPASGVTAGDPAGRGQLASAGMMVSCSLVSVMSVRRLLARTSRPR